MTKPNKSLERVLQEVADEMERQDAIHPDGYPATRDGIRLAIATGEDELKEALAAWREGRCKCSTPRCKHHDWNETRGELLQAAGVILRSIRSLEIARGITWDVPKELVVISPATDKTVKDIIKKAQKGGK